MNSIIGIGRSIGESFARAFGPAASAPPPPPSPPLIPPHSSTPPSSPSSSHSHSSSSSTSTSSSSSEQRPFRYRFNTQVVSDIDSIIMCLPSDMFADNIIPSMHQPSVFSLYFKNQLGGPASSGGYLPGYPATYRLWTSSPSTICVPAASVEYLQTMLLRAEGCSPHIAQHANPNLPGLSAFRNYAGSVSIQAVQRILRQLDEPILVRFVGLKEKFGESGNSDAIHRALKKVSRSIVDDEVELGAVEGLPNRMDVGWKLLDDYSPSRGRKVLFF